MPPGDPHYRAETSLRLPAKAEVAFLAPHMHWRGKDYSYEIVFKDGSRKPLLSVPRWDFSWQRGYYFKEPFCLPEGAELHSVAHWDNSRNNPLNPAPDKEVHVGAQTSDEMMVGFVMYVCERREEPAALPGPGGSR